jgi:hypothetical protein
MPNTTNELFNALGLASPVLWYVHNTAGRPSYEVERVDVEYTKLAGYGVFFAVNEFGNVLNEHGNRRYEANATRATACFIDFDDGTKQEQMERIETFTLKPSAVVETGRGYHVYWFLEPTADFRLWSRIQTALATVYKGDTACSDPARLLRLPGSWHTKQEPVQVVLRELCPERRYTLAELELFCPPEPVQVFVLPERKREVEALHPRLLQENQRHPTLKRVVAGYFAGSAPSQYQERVAEVKAWYVASSRPLKANWEKEVESYCQWIAKKEWGMNV